MKRGVRNDCPDPWAAVPATAERRSEFGYDSHGGLTEAVSLDREINEKTERLKELKAELIAEARSREGELAPTDSGGRRWAAEGSDGRIVRGNFPAPTLKTKIDEGNATRKIKKLAGQAFTRLFVPTISYRPIEKFREAATVLLPKIEARLRFVEDKDLMFLAEVLKVPIQELFPRRESSRRLSDFIEELETTRF